MLSQQSLQIKKLPNAEWVDNNPHSRKLSNDKIKEVVKKYSHDECISLDFKKIPFSRMDFIKKALDKFTNPSYLEIGTHKNECFNEINIQDKVGVDPNAIGEKVIKATSDEFFLVNNKLYDVIFIDGLHTYEQVRKDVINSFKFLKKGGFIFLHDMLPLNWRAECPIRLQGTWNGDVWKVGLELCLTKGIEFVVSIADHGVGIVNKKDDKIDLYDDYEKIKNYTYKNFFNSKVQYIKADIAYDNL